MKIILRALHRSGFQNITISEFPFYIGRNETLFQELMDHSDEMRAAILYLSKRHAVISLNDERFFISDFGSTNGTKINGVPAGKEDIEIRHGDIIVLGKKLEYNIEDDAVLQRENNARDDTSQTVEASWHDLTMIARDDSDDATMVIKDDDRTLNLHIPISLTLLPLDKKSATEPIVIERFPFMVGRDEPAFSKYKGALPQYWQTLSRKHAQIICLEDKISVQDFGSLNGTLLSGEKVENRSVELNNGDKLAFGNFFRYKAIISGMPCESDDQTIYPQASPKETLSDKTTYFVDSPTDYAGLMIHSSQNRNGNEKQDDKAKNGSVFIIKQVVKKIGVLKIAIGLTLLLIVGVLAYYFHISSPDYKIETLIAQKQYEAVLNYTNDLLAKKPDNDKWREHATQALIKTVLPKWQMKLEEGDFTGADEILLHTAAQTDHNPDGLKIVKLLDWVSNIEMYFTQRNAETPLFLFRNEMQLDAIINQWKKTKLDFCRCLEQIRNQDASFKPLHNQIYQHLNILQTDASLYLEPIQKVKAQIHTKLNENRLQDITHILDTFERDYPKIEGTKAVRQDLNNCIKLRTALKEKRMSAISRMLAESKLKTRPFVKWVADFRNNNLPSPQAMLAFKKSSEAWLTGDSDSAIASLELITDKIWKTAAESKLEHYRLIQKQFGNLKKKKGGQAYHQQLLIFFSHLIPGEDDFYLNALKNDFETARKREMQKTRRLFTQANQYWSEYYQQGGITSLMRIESAVTADFKYKARLLKNACQKFKEASAVYTLFDYEIPNQWVKLQKKLSEEANLQRIRMDYSKSVLDSAVFDAKLRLLPNLSERIN